MSAFSHQIQKAERRAPLLVAKLPAHCWSDTYERRPKEAVRVGIRVLAEQDLVQARSEALRLALEHHTIDSEKPLPQPALKLLDDVVVEAYNDALLRFAVARGTSKPDDVEQPYFELAETTIREALSSEGIRFLWEQIVALSVSTSPCGHDLELADEMRLASLLEDGVLERLGERGTRIGRFLRVALRDIDEALEELGP